MQSMQSTTVPRVPRNDAKTLHLLYAISFVDLFAVGLIFPSLGPYLRGKGCTFTQIGALSSVYALLQIISAPIIGSWSDVRGRKLVFVVTLVCSAFGYMMLGFATTVPTFFLYRLFLGIFKQTQTVSKAIIGDIVGSDTSALTHAVSMTTSIGTIGLIFGPIIGGYLSVMNDGFFYICALTAALFVINILIVLMLPSIAPSSTSSTQITPPKGIRAETRAIWAQLHAVSWSQYWDVFTLKFIYILSTTMYFSNQGPYLKQRFGYTAIEIGYALSVVSVVGVFTGFALTPITRRWYTHDTHATARTLHMYIALAACFIGFYLAADAKAFIGALLGMGVCNTALRIVTVELVYDRADAATNRGTLTGVADSVAAFGRFFAPLAGGYIADRHGVDAVILDAGCVATLGCALAAYLHFTIKAKRD